MQIEPIEITGSVETLDNWGRTQTLDARETYKLLITPEEWNDDQVFHGAKGERYFIDDLINKTVVCGPFIFCVTEE